MFREDKQEEFTDLLWHGVAISKRSLAIILKEREEKEQREKQQQ